jgi:endonuclease/exonuclease/phosphatase family metal-dependent hydrolase
MRQIVVGSYNFEYGGLDNGNDARLRRQLAKLRKIQAGAWAFQECSNWQDTRTRTQGLVEEALGMRGFFARSNRGPGGDVAVFIDESQFRFTEARHEEQPVPYWHAVAHVIVQVEGFGLLRLASAHLAPSCPDQRLIEADAMQLLAEKDELGPLILGGDFNAFPVGYPVPDVTGQHPAKVRKKSDTRAAQSLEDFMTDVGRHLGNTTPTVGHRRSDTLAYPADRLYSTLPPESFTRFEVIHEDKPDSDHLAVVGEFTLVA